MPAETTKPPEGDLFVPGLSSDSSFEGFTIAKDCLIRPENERLTLPSNAHRTQSGVLLPEGVDTVRTIHLPEGVKTGPKDESLKLPGLDEILSLTEKREADKPEPISTGEVAAAIFDPEAFILRRLKATYKSEDAALIPNQKGHLELGSLARQTEDVTFLNRNTGERETYQAHAPSLLEAALLKGLDIAESKRLARTGFKGKAMAGLGALARRQLKAEQQSVKLDAPDLANRCVEMARRSVKARGSEVYQILEMIKLSYATHIELAEIMEGNGQLNEPYAFKLAVNIAAENHEPIEWEKRQEEKRQALLSDLAGNPQYMVDNFGRLRREARKLAAPFDPRNPPKARIGFDIEFGYSGNDYEDETDSNAPYIRELDSRAAEVLAANPDLKESEAYQEANQQMEEEIMTLREELLEENPHLTLAAARCLAYEQLFLEPANEPSTHDLKNDPKGWVLGFDGINREVRKDGARLELDAEYVQDMVALGDWLVTADHLSSVHFHLDRVQHTRPGIGKLLIDDGLWQEGIRKSWNHDTWEIRGTTIPVKHEMLDLRTMMGTAALFIEASQAENLTERQDTLTLMNADADVTFKSLVWSYVCNNVSSPEGRLAALFALEDEMSLRKFDVEIVTRNLDENSKRIAAKALVKTYFGSTQTKQIQKLARRYLEPLDLIELAANSEITIENFKALVLEKVTEKDFEDPRAAAIIKNLENIEERAKKDRKGGLSLVQQRLLLETTAYQKRALTKEQILSLTEAVHKSYTNTSDSDANIVNGELALDILLLKADENTANSLVELNRALVRKATEIENQIGKFLPSLPRKQSSRIVDRLLTIDTPETQAFFSEMLKEDPELFYFFICNSDTHPSEHLADVIFEEVIVTGREAPMAIEAARRLPYKPERLEIIKKLIETEVDAAILQPYQVPAYSTGQKVEAYIDVLLEWGKEPKVIEALMSFLPITPEIEEETGLKQSMKLEGTVSRETTGVILRNMGLIDSEPSTKVLRALLRAYEPKADIEDGTKNRQKWEFIEEGLYIGLAVSSDEEMAAHALRQLEDRNDLTTIACLGKSKASAQALVQMAEGEITHHGYFYSKDLYLEAVIGLLETIERGNTHAKEEFLKHFERITQSGLSVLVADAKDVKESANGEDFDTIQGELALEIITKALKLSCEQGLTPYELELVEKISSEVAKFNLQDMVRPILDITLTAIRENQPQNTS